MDKVLKLGNNMDWKKYEENVYDECCRIFSEANVAKNVRVKGRYSEVLRQIDILVSDCIIDGKKTSIMLDAKKYSKKIDVKCVESFISMLEDTGIPKGILVTSMGFSKAAIKRAHKGTENVQVEILDMHDLKLYQSSMAIPFAGKYGVILKSPFGWIVDGRKTDTPARLYQRGRSFEQACNNKEWMYIQFWHKDDNISTINELVQRQNEDILKTHGNIPISGEWNEGIYIRKATIESHSITEITGYKDFDGFIFFGVLFCEEEFFNRNVGKLKYLLSSAIPVKVENKIAQA